MLQKHGFFGEKSLYFQRRLLSFEDIGNRRPSKDALCIAA